MARLALLLLLLLSACERGPWSLNLYLYMPDGVVKQLKYTGFVDFDSCMAFGKDKLQEFYTDNGKSGTPAQYCVDTSYKLQ